MSLKNTTVWLIRQGVCLASWQLGEAGERLEARLDAMANARGVDVLDALEPVTSHLRTAGQA